MSETKYFKCPCAHCGGHIEFPAEATGLSMACPHCGQTTELTAPLAAAPDLPESETSRVGRKILWLAIAGVLLIAALLAGLAALQLFKDRLEARRPGKSAPAPGQSSRPAPAAEA